jgi:hypothetical protein
VGDQISALKATGTGGLGALAAQITAAASRPASSIEPGQAHLSCGAAGGSKYRLSAW